MCNPTFSSAFQYWLKLPRSNVISTENFPQARFLIELVNLPQNDINKQNLPPAHSRGAVTFSGLWLLWYTQKDCEINVYYNCKI